MDLSPLETRVLKAISDARPGCSELKAQLESLTVFKREYTGCGVYTDFSLPAEAQPFDETLWKFEDMPKVHGTHPSLEAGAGFILWFKNGLVTCLEGYTYEDNWPENENLFVLSV